MRTCIIPTVFTNEHHLDHFNVYWTSLDSLNFRYYLPQPRRNVIPKPMLSADGIDQTCQILELQHWISFMRNDVYCTNDVLTNHYHHSIIFIKNSVHWVMTTIYVDGEKYLAEIKHLLLKGSYIQCQRAVEIQKKAPEPLLSPTDDS